MPKDLKNTDRLCIHTMTTRLLSLKEACDAYRAIGATGITVWRQHLEPVGVKEATKIIGDSGLRVVSLCRGGFFPARSAQKRQEAISENLRIIDEAAAIFAPVVVLVCGAEPGLELPVARQHIMDAIHTIEPAARDAGVMLAIEPLHPMYTDDRSAVNTLEQANNMVTALGSPAVGIALDVYHTWWDPNLKAEIQRAGKSILSFHVCDWRTPTRDILNDREVMGSGCIPIRQIKGWAEDAGFHGPIEVEIFSNEYWEWNQQQYLRRIQRAYLHHV